jgi:hypothetical protein
MKQVSSSRSLKKRSVDSDIEDDNIRRTNSQLRRFGDALYDGNKSRKSIFEEEVL